MLSYALSYLSEISSISDYFSELPKPSKLFSESSSSEDVSSTTGLAIFGLGAAFGFNFLRALFFCTIFSNLPISYYCISDCSDYSETSSPLADSVLPLA
jgi:hypothetical protein